MDINLVHLRINAKSNLAVSSIGTYVARNIYGSTKKELYQLYKAYKQWDSYVREEGNKTHISAWSSADKTIYVDYDDYDSLPF